MADDISTGGYLGTIVGNLEMKKRSLELIAISRLSILMIV